MKKKIMIVDDDPDVRYTIRDNLESNFGAEFEVLDAESGEQCLELLKNKEIPDLILLDIMMPGISGWETQKRLKESETWDKIPIIFLTARTDRVAREAGRFLGEDYIEKPYKIDELKKRIDHALKNP